MGLAIAVLVATVADTALFGLDAKFTVRTASLFASDACLLFAEKAVVSAIIVSETSDANEAGRVALGGGCCAGLVCAASDAAEFCGGFAVWGGEGLADLTRVAVVVVVARAASRLCTKQTCFAVVAARTAAFTELGDGVAVFCCSAHRVLGAGDAAAFLAGQTGKAVCVLCAASTKT